MKKNHQTRMKMKQMLLILSILSLVLITACQPIEPTAPAGEGAMEETEGAMEEEAVAEPTAGEIAQDLDTSDLDEIEEDLDLLVLE